MQLGAVVDPELLRRECLPCQWCGAEIDYSAEPGAARSFVVQNNRAAHYGCAAAHAGESNATKSGYL